MYSKCYKKNKYQKERHVAAKPLKINGSETLASTVLFCEISLLFLLGPQLPAMIGPGGPGMVPVRPPFGMPG